METQKFYNTDFYEKYVFGKLSEDEEGQFEEHLLFCEHCKEQLELTESIIHGVKKTQSNTTTNIQKRTGSQRFISWFGIAASLLILISLGILVKKNKQSTNEITKQEIHVDSTSIMKETADSLPSDINTPQEKEQKEILIAEAYKPLPAYENAIKNYLRSNSFDVLSPKLSAEINDGDTLIFNWKSDSQNLLLVIFDNKGNIVFEEQTSPPSTFKKKLKNGLYYWQLETEEEAIFTGKFIMIGE